MVQTFNPHTLSVSERAEEIFSNTWQFQSIFHKQQIQRVKKNLGKDCTYLSHEKRGDKRFIKAIMINSTGGKDTVTIEINSNLSLVKREEYDKVMETLGERSYERSTETV